MAAQQYTERLRSRPKEVKKLLLDRLSEEAEAPAQVPTSGGSWHLNNLRWQVLQALIRAPRSDRLYRHVPKVRDAIVSAGLGPPVLLRPHHLASEFDCGVELLNEKIRKSLSEVVQDGVEQQLTTYVVTSEDTIIGYYSTRPIVAVPESGSAGVPLSFIARCGVDRRWRKPGLADNMLLYMLHQAWNGPERDRPQALVGLAVNTAAKRFFRKIGIRPLGDAIDPRGVIVPAADLADVQALGPVA